MYIIILDKWIINITKIAVCKDVNNIQTWMSLQAVKVKNNVEKSKRGKTGA